MSRNFDLKEGEHDHTKEYLERYLSIEKKRLNAVELCPPKQFY